MERRDFIKQGCMACMALGAGIVSTTLASCSTLPVLRSDMAGNRIPFDPSQFTDGVDSILLRTRNLEHDILVVKKPEGGYRSLYMQCTHNHFDLSCNKSKIFCTSHGAEFDMHGNVTKGPAKEKLKSFSVVEEHGKLFVQIA